MGLNVLFKLRFFSHFTYYYMTSASILGVSTLIVVAALIAIYNTLIGHKNKVVESFSLIDVYLKKRFDLIPNLVELVKQNMSHERGILETVTAMRSRTSTGSLNTDEKIQLSNQMESAMRQVMITVENYPTLKSNENFLALQRSWYEIEENIAAARRTYNASVNQYNTARETFPSNLISGFLGFDKKASFEINEGERKNISAKDLF